MLKHSIWVLNLFSDVKIHSVLNLQCCGTHSLYVTPYIVIGLHTLSQQYKISLFNKDKKVPSGILDIFYSMCIPEKQIWSRQKHSYLSFYKASCRLKYLTAQNIIMKTFPWKFQQHEHPLNLPPPVDAPVNILLRFEWHFSNSAHTYDSFETHMMMCEPKYWYGTCFVILPRHGSFLTRNSSSATQPPPTRTMTVLRRIRTSRNFWDSPNCVNTNTYGIYKSNLLI